MRRTVTFGLVLATLTIATLTAAAAAAAAERRPFTVHDMLAMERIADPQPSPDGLLTAFVVTTMDLDANRGRSDLWLVSNQDGAPRRLTSHPAGDSNPRWADPRTLLFLSSRSGSSQVWRINADGGEATQVTDLPLDVGALVVGPDGTSLFLALGVFPDCADPIPCTVERLAERTANPASGLLFDRLFVRHWDTWEDGLRNHIFRLDLDEHGRAAGAPVDLMPGVDADSPTNPWGGPEDLTVSPDGRWLVYAAKAVSGSEEAWSTNYDLYAVPTDGSAPRRNLTEANLAWDATPAFSPDGSQLAYLAMARPGYESDRFRVVVMSWPDGQARVLTERWDRSPASLAWAADGKSLYATADNAGNHSLFRVNLDSGDAAALIVRHHNSSPAPLPDGGVVFAQDSLVSPVELYLLRPGIASPRRLTDLNGGRLEELAFGSYDQFSFIGAHSDQVSGYIIRPVGFRRDGTYPLAFLIHGGPQGSFDDHWHYRWNPQIYAAAGYVTVTIDFHGSTGYGQAFTDAIRGDWGGAPFVDLMTGLDWVLAHHPYVDSQRMAALGASYGGYMINWIQGQTDRFAALVCHDGNLDEYFAYFDTEELWFPEWENEGTPWENPEAYREHSPIAHVADWSTPELVIHGAKDYRVVDTQGLATFNALQRLGIPSRLLYFPDENHWVLKPQNSIQWHQVVLEWIGRWTAPGAEPSS